MAKIAQLSDMHLFYRSGKRETDQGLNVREWDGYVAFTRVIREIIEEKPDCLLVCGDTFHIPNPNIAAIVYAQNQFRKVVEAGIPVYILAGNHDVTDVRAEVAASRVLHDPDRTAKAGVHSFVEPYVKIEVVEGVHLHLISHHMYSSQGATMSSIKPVEGEVNVLATHGSIIDPLLKIKLHTEQSPREVVIPDPLLNDHHWNGILLGHIHERGYAGSRDGGETDSLKKNVFYNGSLIRRGFSDKECPLGRGWTLWTIDSDGVMTPDARRVPQRPQFDFPLIDAQGLSAQAISELIIERLRKTQPQEGPIFDFRKAPLVRQKVKNMDPTKSPALDWAQIHQEAGHALLWDYKPLKADTEEERTEAKLKGVTLEDYVATTDMVNLYDNWVEKSSSLGRLHEDLRPSIRDQARKFVELGQEVSLDE